MIQFKKISIGLLLLLVLSSCKTSEKERIEGLWMVSNVSMGPNSNTPVARWIRFEKDGKQVSGNGWLQHSYGTWSLDGVMIKISDKNGLLDPSGPFTCTINGNQMFWTRKEGGGEVKVTLERIERIPQSDGNRLIGLWKLIASKNEGNDVTAVLNPTNNAMLFLRWDQVFEDCNMPKGRKSGIYKIHGHRNEIQLVNYGEDPAFSFWSFEVDETTLTLLSTDKKSSMQFERIHQFLPASKP